MWTEIVEQDHQRLLLSALAHIPQPTARVFLYLRHHAAELRDTEIRAVNLSLGLGAETNTRRLDRALLYGLIAYQAVGAGPGCHDSGAGRGGTLPFERLAPALWIPPVLNNARDPERRLVQRLVSGRCPPAAFAKRLGALRGWPRSWCGALERDADRCRRDVLRAARAMLGEDCPGGPLVLFQEYCCSSSGCAKRYLEARGLDASDRARVEAVDAQLQRALARAVACVFGVRAGILVGCRI